MESSPHLSDTWEVYPQLPQEYFQSSKDARINPILVQLLYNRGLKTIAEMQSFINASYTETLDPLSLIDMPRAIARIQQALSDGEHITVYGDYDADGVTSSALLFRALRMLKQQDFPPAPLDHHIPHRLRDGCGLNNAALDLLKARGTQLIITTDCASSDVAQVEYARSLGMDVIVTDHHHPPLELPRAYAMVNPWRPDSTYGERYLCGVGIAFKLTQALYRAYNRTVEDEKDLLDLVAIGTVADIAPLLGENHTFVRIGMEQLNATRKPGLRALIKNANLQPGKIRERDIAFGLAPRLNAAGRMKEASIAFQLLVTDDVAEAETIATELEQLNVLRQQQTEDLMRNVREQAQGQAGMSVVLVSGNDWHEGIIGLVAGKLAEEINKPVLVLSNDLQTKLSRGSARSQKDFNIIEALSGFAGQMERYGGHAQAGGFTIRSERIEDLRAYLLQWKENGGLPASTRIEGTDLPDQTGVITEQEIPEPEPVLKKADLIFTKLDLLSYPTYKQLRKISPFGAGNPEPIFKMEHLRLINTWTSGPNKQNLRLRLEETAGGKQIIGTYTRGAPEQKRIESALHIDIIFRLDSAQDDAKPEVWVKVLHIQPAE
ncbi:MAG: single-stranded-DNA-specific exonuclease RecJ [Ktedonobacteraceae bacterium]|nr:single-stranded-DNA-specific exonuclease RecJ [Ktedonobacteraceae bacterium]